MKLKDKINKENIKLLVFQGSWCPMCVAAMPQIAYFMSNHKIDEDRIEIINVNNTKTEPNELIKQYSITRVPTIIFLKDNKEFARITEFAPKGWETEIEDRISSTID